MANIKSYKIQYLDNYFMEFEIDHDIANEEYFHDINKFWGHWKDRLDENGSSFIGALKLLVAQIYFVHFSGNWNIKDVISQFDYDKESCGQEGYPKLDGSSGIKLVDFDEFSFDTDEMTVYDSEDEALETAPVFIAR